MLMTVKASGALVGAALIASGPLQIASAQTFVRASNDNIVEAGCITSALAGAGGIAQCLCEASGDAFALCEITTEAGASAGSVIGVAESMATANTNLTGRVRTTALNNDIKINVHASCTLQDIMGIQAIDNGPGQALDGALMQYSAIYMWPEVNGTPVAEPVRLCARGTETTLSADKSLFLGGELYAIQEQDFGMVGGYSWVAENVPPSTPSGHEVKVNFLLVGAVDSAILQAYGSDLVGIGVNSFSKLKDRNMFIEAGNLNVIDQ
ncbi:MAG: hypothetical protein EOM91_07570 [Sphingobacteriia bacterium]|nr:hypothetical protein [Sphingobacteriia bacterium]NCC40545.1 hypothetical protein [Gammaproteobacteria bacterium]